MRARYASPPADRRAAASRCGTWLALLLAAGCGGAPRPATLPTLASLRTAAQARPDDPEAWRRLAFARMSWPEGGSAEAGRAIQQALRLAPHDARLRWLAGLEAYGHGRTVEALDHWVATLRLAARPPGDPEVALATLASLPMLQDVATAALHERLPGLAELLGPPALEALGDAGPLLAIWLGEAALRAGDRALAERAAAAAGCPTRWRVAGPFGELPYQDFRSGELEPDRHRAEPLADRYRVSARQGERETLTIAAPYCLARLPSRWARPGVWYAESEVETGRDGTVRLHLEVPAPFRLEVDGERALEVDGLRRLPPSVHRVTLRLAPGRHRLRLVLASRGGAPRFRVARVRGAARPSGRGEDPFEAPLLRGAVLLREASGHHARLHLQRWARRLGGLGPFGRWLLAMAWGGDPLVGPREARDAVREQYRLAGAEDPLLWPAAARAALELARDGEPLQALALLRETDRRLGGHPALRSRVLELLLDRGWMQDAEREARDAVRDHPGSRLAWQGLLRVGQRRRSVRLQLEAARQLARLDATSWDPLSILVRARRHDEAEAELRRLRELDAGQREARWWRRAAELARARGLAPEEVARRLRRLLAVPPPPPELQDTLAAVDLVGARQGLEAVRGALVEAMAARRFDTVGRHRLRERLQALGEETELDRWRFDAHAVLRAYREEEDRGSLPEAFRTAPQVLLFDGMTDRLFESGAVLRFVHQVYLLQSQEAVDRFGELRVPDGARLLRAATLKPDGTELEPDLIAGKDSLSFPRLEPGDAVEFEYVRLLEPHAVFPRGASSGFFYFVSFETPFYHSELRLVAPEGVPLRFEERHGAPRRQTRGLPGGLREHRWVARRMAALRPEPQAPPPEQWVPVVRWAARPTSWEHVLAALRERLLPQEVADPRHEALARRIAGEGAVRERARRLFAWVREHVEPTADVFSPAAPMVADRRGHPLRVFAYLARLAGLPVRLLIASNVTRDPEEPPIPDASHYPQLLAAVQPEEGEPIYLFPPSRTVPFGWLPPHLVGAAARSLEPPFARFRLPEPSPERTSRMQTEATLRLGADGSAVLRGRILLDGAVALQFREGLLRASDEERHQIFARLLPRLWFPATVLERLELEHLEQPDEPLLVRFDCRVPSLAERPAVQQRQAATWRLPLPRLARPDASAFAMPERRSPLLWSTHQLETLRLRIELPAGAAPRRLPEPIVLRSRPVTVEARVERDGDQALRYRVDLVQRAGRVSPERFGALAHALREVARRFEARIELVPPAADR